MVGRATFAACNWILDHYAGVANFYLESNFATDKKGSQVNMMRTRGKRVTAEATATREELRRSLYCELTPDGGLYGSLTIPSLIVATHGGGTGLATRRECLEVLGCYGKGKVNKLAEVVAGVALAGEISLGATIASSIGWRRTRSMAATGSTVRKWGGTPGLRGSSRSRSFACRISHRRGAGLETRRRRGRPPHN